MNSIMQRWIANCRRELRDRTLVCNQRHLLTVLREYEDFYRDGDKGQAMIHFHISYCATSIAVTLFWLVQNGQEAIQPTSEVPPWDCDGGVCVARG